MNRRDFLRTAAVAGAGLALAGNGRGQTPAGGDALNVAIIGVGAQGMVLLRDCLNIPGLRFKAICDIWPYSQRYAGNTLKKYDQEVTVYEDYREMLDKETDVQAVIVATPDFVHAEHAVACLKSGKHVYCEKEMSHRLADAAEMVKAARDSGKLLQIGHQRRSSPVYKLVLEAIRQDGLCGRLTTGYGQWNRSVQDKLTWPERYVIDDATLKKFGYASMEHFRNWRWYKPYSAGPIADLGSHQIDIFSWFLGADPHSLVAMGGSDYYPDREWYEDVMVIYDFMTQQGGVRGSARAFYQVVNTNGFGNYYERFGGDKGSVTISENAKLCYFAPEPGAEVPAWMSGVEPVERNGGMVYPLVEALRKKSAAAEQAMAEWDKKNVHQLHLENFFGAVRQGNAKLLTCPPEIGYATAVAVLNVIPAIESGARNTFTDAEFKA